MNPDDYDNDGNNIVPCPICLNVYCESKDGGECPDEKEFVKYHTQKEMDLVYVLGTGSKWEDNEIRYSLRSADRNLPHRNVIVVGERPEWLQNIIHIAIPDGFANVKGGKYRNVIRKIIGACNDDRVSKDFVLMNDDFFTLKPINHIEPYTVGSLQSVIDHFRERYGIKTGGNNQYINALTRTLRFLQKQGIADPKSYNVHVPIVYNKANFIDMTDRVDWLAQGYSWRSLYGNLYDIGSVERTDPKISSKVDLLHFLKRTDYGDFLSISDNVAQDRNFQFWIEMQFPHKSKYEI